MEFETFDRSGSTPADDAAPLGEPQTALPRDPWTSPLWGRADTVGGYWADPSPIEALPRPEMPAPAPRRSSTSRVLAGVAVLIAAVLIGVGIVRALPQDATAPVAAPPSASAPASPLPSDPAAPSDPAQGALPGQGQVPGQEPAPTSSPASAADQEAIDAVSPAIVNITTTIGYDGNEAAGTGEVLTPDGVILTNHHVIAGATSIKVAVAGTTTTYLADVIGYDAAHDIGVIKLRDASGMATVPLGDSASVREGDHVIGLGNAGGLGGKPIAAPGTVTGLDKEITAMDSANGVSERLSGLIETDAAIAPGDSGGSLVSSEGEVVGIITAGSVSQTGRSTATDGYAIPINEALSIAQDIRDGKQTSTNHIGQSAFLGITVAGSTAGSRSGVAVNSVVPGSAAARAGLSAGDRIISIEGTTVTTNASLRAAIAPHHPGDTVSVTWIDASGKTQTHDVTFGTGPIG